MISTPWLFETKTENGEGGGVAPVGPATELFIFLGGLGGNNGKLCQTTQEGVAQMSSYGLKGWLQASWTITLPVEQREPATTIVDKVANTLSQPVIILFWLLDNRPDGAIGAIERYMRHVAPTTRARWIQRQTAGCGGSGRSSHGPIWASLEVRISTVARADGGFWVRTTTPFVGCCMSVTGAHHQRSPRASFISFTILLDYRQLPYSVQEWSLHTDELVLHGTGQKTLKSTRTQFVLLSMGFLVTTRHTGTLC